jgi:hypothetical protein
MEFHEFSRSDQHKLVAIVRKTLANDNGLAMISKLLQNKGLSQAAAKELIQKEAHAFWQSQRNIAAISMLVGFLGIGYVLYSVVRGIRGDYDIWGVGLFLAGLFLFFRNRRRLKYLKSILGN